MRVGCAVLLLAALARAGLQPSFEPDSLTWRATHIVFVRTNGEAGQVEVLESLHGDLARGETVPIEGLAKYHGEVVQYLFDPPEKPPRITGARVLLFLQRSGRTWKPAAESGDVHVSAAWIEDERAYGHFQVINPGPAVLIDLETTEQELANRIARILETRARLGRVAKEADPERRATGAATYLGSDIWAAHWRALEILEGCGAAAAKVLRGVLEDPMRADVHEAVIEVLGKTGGKGVGAELAALLARQVAFWKKTAPGLKPGWWNLGGADGQRLRREYGIAHAALRALERLRYAPCRETVTALRDYWRSLPQLNDPSGLDQMAKAADAVLSALDAK